MTYTPIPKADLLSPEDLLAALADLASQVTARLYHAEADATWAASQIAALYAELADLDAAWLWGGSATGVDPGASHVRISVGTGNARTFALSTLPDGSASDLNFAALSQGSTVVLTDDPVAPPITAFRQYVVASDVVDHGSWVSFHAVRIATFGTQDTPALESRVRLLLR